MIKLTDLKEGDIVNVLHDGEEREGVVQQIGRDDNKACINNGIQEFWYPIDQIIPIPLTEERLITTLGFDKMETENGVKYMKGPFRILVHDPGNFTNLEIWYREALLPALSRAGFYIKQPPSYIPKELVFLQPVYTMPHSTQALLPASIFYPIRPRCYFGLLVCG